MRASIRLCWGVIALILAWTLARMPGYCLSMTESTAGPGKDVGRACVETGEGAGTMGSWMRGTCLSDDTQQPIVLYKMI